MKKIEMTREQKKGILAELFQEAREFNHLVLEDNEFTRPMLMEMTGMSRSTAITFVEKKLKAGVVMDTGKRGAKSVVIYAYVVKAE